MNQMYTPYEHIIGKLKSNAQNQGLKNQKIFYNQKIYNMYKYY